jgi:hypothetical protein
VRVQHTLLLQRNKLVSTNTGATVASRLVSHGELGKVVSNHFSLREARVSEQRKREDEVTITKQKMRKKIWEKFNKP